MRPLADDLLLFLRTAKTRFSDFGDWSTLTEAKALSGDIVRADGAGQSGAVQGDIGGSSGLEIRVKMGPMTPQTSVRGRRENDECVAFSRSSLRIAFFGVLFSTALDAG